MRHAKKLLLLTALTVLLFSSREADAQNGYRSFYGPSYSSFYRGGFGGYSTNRLINYNNSYSRAAFYNSNVVRTKSTKTFSERRKERVAQRACRKSARGK